MPMVDAGELVAAVCQEMAGHTMDLLDEKFGVKVNVLIAAEPIGQEADSEALVIAAATSDLHEGVRRMLEKGYQLVLSRPPDFTQPK